MSERFTRRQWMTVLAGAGAMVGALWPRGARGRRLRPPGAVSSPTFEQRCIRCYRCAEVCPVKAIRLDATANILGTDTPYIVARERACIACMKCTQACPTAALEPVAAEPEVVAQRVRLGVPVLTKGRCLAWTGKGICRLCYYVCPYPERAVRLDGVRQGPVFDSDACIGCGLCEEACPETAQAIRIEPRP